MLILNAYNRNGVGSILTILWQANYCRKCSFVKVTVFPPSIHLERCAKTGFLTNVGVSFWLSARIYPGQIFALWNNSFLLLQVDGTVSNMLIPVFSYRPSIFLLCLPGLEKPHFCTFHWISCVFSLTFWASLSSKSINQTKNQCKSAMAIIWKISFIQNFELNVD